MCDSGHDEKYGKEECSGMMMSMAVEVMMSSGDGWLERLIEGVQARKDGVMPSWGIEVAYDRGRT